MTNLAARAQELVENVKPACRQNDDGIAWERFIVTVKSKEVVAWSFDCLTCDRSTCPRMKSPDKAPQNASECWVASEY